ncbi:unnamed protein product [Polarella glacialis]|uniref:Uncharacterized protein n=2 Tax=Polarella glacialis TaxID=89957 RepID=A0A813KEC9_POLGL|nr:unnamed protein product [Polarella glacialis]
MSGQLAMWMCLGFVLFGSITAQNITATNTTSTTMTTSATTYTATTTLATTAATTLAATTSTVATTLAATTSTVATTLAATTSTAATTLAATTSTSSAAPTTTVAKDAATTSQGASTVTASIVTAGTTTDAATTATETSSQVTSTVTTSIVTVGTTGETQQITVFGKMSMVLPNASAFVNDPAAKQGIAKSLANIAGVAVNRVSVTLSLGTRRLSARQLQSQSVIVDYTIKVSSASVAAATSLGDQMKGKIKAVPLADLGAQILKNVAAVSTSGTTYTITVTGVTAEAVVEALVVTNTTSMKPEEKSGSIRVAGSSWLFVGALGLLLSGSRLRGDKI